MTNNDPLIARLVGFLDAYQPDDRDTTVTTVVQALLHRAMGGAVATDGSYDRQHRTLELAFADIISSVTGVSMFDSAFADTLRDLLRDIDDLAANAND